MRISNHIPQTEHNYVQSKFLADFFTRRIRLQDYCNVIVNKDVI